jgi:hypothetical protein
MIQNQWRAAIGYARCPASRDRVGRRPRIENPASYSFMEVGFRELRSARALGVRIEPDSVSFMETSHFEMRAFFSGLKKTRLQPRSPDRDCQVQKWVGRMGAIWLRDLELLQE